MRPDRQPRMPLRAFHDDPTLKALYLDRVSLHELAGQIIQNLDSYWRNDQGCAVGCLIHEQIRPHRLFRVRLGLPSELAMLLDDLFELLPKKEAVKLPWQFIEAIPVGAKTRPVLPAVALWLTGEEALNLMSQCHPKLKSAVDLLHQLFRTKPAGELSSKTKWKKLCDPTEIIEKHFDHYPGSLTSKEYARQVQCVELIVCLFDWWVRGLNFHKLVGWLPKKSRLPLVRATRDKLLDLLANSK